MTRDSVRTILKACDGLRGLPDLPVHFCKLPLLCLLCPTPGTFFGFSWSPPASLMLLGSLSTGITQRRRLIPTLLSHPPYLTFPCWSSVPSPGFVASCLMLLSIVWLFGHCPISPTGLYSLCEQVQCSLSLSLVPVITMSYSGV